MPRLTEQFLRSLQPKSVRYEVPDNVITGLRITVQPSGVMSWVLRYRVGRRQRKWSLGRYPSLGLADARDLAQEGHLKIARGGDPAAEKIERRTVLGDDSVAAVVEAYNARECRALKSKETANLLRRDVVGAWGHRRLAEVRRAEVHALVDRCLDQGMPVRANKLLGVMRRLWRWAIARGFADASPVEGIKPPHREVSRDRVLNDAELVAIWRAGEQVGWPFGPILSLLVLSGARRTEVSGARWSEIDFKRRLWTIPRERRKGSVLAHDVPLSDAVIGILRALPRFDSDFLFPAQKRGKGHFSGYAKAKERLDQLSGISGWRLHDLRRTVATGLQALGARLEVIDEVLGHASGSRAGIVGVYQRHRFEKEKRAALDSWSRHIQGLLEPAAAEKVVQLRG